MVGKPRVFVSSIMEGYQEFREAARLGIEQAGGKAVLVEDEPARPASPRNACLDLIASCDAVLTILGPRGGFRAPSGKLVVQEEFDEARARGLPVVLLLHEVARDPSGEELERHLSAWVGGRLRRSFKTPEDLAAETGRAIAPLLETMSRPIQDPRVVQELVEDPQHGGPQHDAVLRIACVPAVADEVVDPLEFDAPQFRKDVLRLAHDCDLLNYEFSKDLRTTSEQLTIKQGVERGRERGYAEIAIRTSGLVAASVQVTGRTEMSGPLSGTFSSMFEILTTDLERACLAAFHFVFQLCGYVDPHERYGSWIYNVGLLNPGMRQIVIQPARSNQASSVSLGGTDVVAVYDRPRTISRSVLGRPEPEVDRIVVLLQKRLAEARSPY